MVYNEFFFLLLPKICISSFQLWNTMLIQQPDKNYSVIQHEFSCLRWNIKMYAISLIPLFALTRKPTRGLSFKGD